MIRFASLLLAAAGIILVSCVNLTRLEDREVTFAEIRPILQNKCLECHNSRYQFAQLNLENRTLAKKGGRSGPTIIAGQPQKSLLYRVLLLGHDNPVAMPPTPDRIAREQEQLLHDWILQGAPWPDGKAGKIQPPQDLTSAH